MASSVIEDRTRFGTVQTISLATSWTAPCDGIVIHNVDWTSGSDGYEYIKDETSNSFVALISHYGSLGQRLEGTSFPVLKGHSYKVTLANQVGTRTSYFYPL